MLKSINYEDLMMKKCVFFKVQFRKLYCKLYDKFELVLKKSLQKSLSHDD